MDVSVIIVSYNGRSALEHCLESLKANTVFGYTEVIVIDNAKPFLPYDKIDLDGIKSDGYSFQIEMNYHAWKRNFRMHEMPIVFADRLIGQSKMSRRIVWEAAFLVWKLRFASLFRKLP